MAQVPAVRGGNPVVAYEVGDLGKQIAKYIGIADKNIATLESLGTPLADRIKLDAPGLDAEALSIVYDRLVKAGLNLVKAVDELARLHSFTQGGPDTRPDLSSMGEIELRAVVIAGIRSLGITPEEIRALVEGK